MKSRMRVPHVIAITGATLAAFVAPSVGAPGFTGATSVNASVRSDTRQVELLADGSSLIAGAFAGTAQFGTTPPLTSSGSNDAFVARRRADGSYAWSTRIAIPSGTSITDIAVGADGSSAVVGQVAAAGGGYAFVSRLGGGGAVEWTASVRDSASASQASLGTVALAADGGVVVGGRGSGSPITFTSATGPNITVQAGTYDGYVARLGATGTFEWVTTVTGGGDEGVRGLAVRGDGSIVAVGAFTGTASFGSPSVQLTSASAGENGFVARLTSSGSVTGAERVGATHAFGASLNDVAVTPAGDAVVVGSGYGTVDFGGTLTTVRSGTDSNGIVALQGPGGGFRWANASDGSGTSLRSVAVRPDGTSVAVGGIDGAAAVQFGSTSLPPGPWDTLTAAVGVSATGEFRWAATGGSTGQSGQTEASAVSAADDGAVQLGGFFDSFLPATFGPTTITGAGGYNGYLAFALDVPVTPGAPTARAGEEQAEVTISPIAGSTIISYQVVASPGGRTCTVTVPATSCTVTGLAGGVPHVFTSTAVNAAGSSPASAASGAVTPTAASNVTPTPAPVVRPLRATNRCVARRCTTTGTVPSGATRVTQAATRLRGTSANAREAAVNTARGRCTIAKAKRKGASRTYTCSITLPAGRWRITTSALVKSTVVARATRTVTAPRR